MHPPSSGPGPGRCITADTAIVGACAVAAGTLRVGGEPAAEHGRATGLLRERVSPVDDRTDAIDLRFDPQARLDHGQQAVRTPTPMARTIRGHARPLCPFPQGLAAAARARSSKSPALRAAGSGPAAPRHHRPAPPAPRPSAPWSKP